MTLLDAALEYAANRLPVFPCLPRGKEPAVPKGFYAATTNPETIKRCWRIPDRNIGIPTGIVSGVWVLDIDGDEGEASLCDLKAKHGKLPATWISTTGRGRHIWFRYTAIPSSTGRIAPGLDVKADGGYVVAPPSIHTSGHAYAWVVPPEGEPAEAPAWLVALARRRPIPSSRNERSPISVGPMAILTDTVLLHSSARLQNSPPPPLDFAMPRSIVRRSACSNWSLAASSTGATSPIGSSRRAIATAY
jgi:hypothetical protein